jgi:CubicO group peptidase (beta-lactamase class C family)
MTISITRPLALAIAASLIAVSHALAGQAAGPEKAFWNEAVSEMRQAGITGASFALVRRNRILARETYGLADVERNKPVDENTIFHWASITKTFTGIAIMQLRDRGQLSLDDPIVKYVPELNAVHNPYGKMSDITIRHLMSHSAGFRNPTWIWRDPDKAWQPFEPTDWNQLVAMMPYTEVLFTPGSKYSYSNPGVIYLGRVIEVITGDDFEVYVDKNIFKPLEMYRSYFDATPYHLAVHRSHSYYVETGKRVAGEFDANTGITVSNGGLNSPMPDMIRYASFLAGDPARQREYDAVLKRSSLEEMWRPILVAGDVTQGQMRATTSIGLSFFIDDIGGRRYVGHTGTQNGFKTYLTVCPATHTASILAFNTDTGSVDAESRIAAKVIALHEAASD